MCSVDRPATFAAGPMGPTMRRVLAMTRTKANGWRGGFSLIELVIVVVIIGIIAAIAIPKLSRGAAGAADSSLAGDLKVLRTAIDMYATEHGGTYPTATNFVGQMTTYTDDAGAAVGTKDNSHPYGPYLRAVPALPVGSNKGSTTVAASAGTGVGWVYNQADGTIKANATESDAKGTVYNTY